MSTSIARLPSSLRLPHSVPCLSPQRCCPLYLVPLDPRCLSALYVQAITVHAAPTGTVQGIGATFSSERHSSITAENLSRKWNIGIDTAKKTLQVTTQRGIRTGSTSIAQTLPRGSLAFEPSAPQWELVY